VPRPEREAGALLPLRFEHVGLVLGGAAVLADLDFELAAGGCSVILGPNGSGKTQLLRLAHGLAAPTSGRVRWCGPGARGAADAHALRLRGQAMVLQRPVLLRRRVRANLEYPLRLRGVAPAERRARVAAVLEQARLEGLAGRPARALSVGEQQRIAVARAWVVEPEVLWLDEPASALDPGATRALEETVRRIRASGTKVVMTTHDLGQARRLADEVLFLHRGRVLEKTPAVTFFDEPRSPEGRAFLKGELLS
jgi:tungstate transport system ATP-binding protein